jgi:hypothetical protein
MEKQQIILDAIQFWLADTTEPYDDWDWDGEFLTIFVSDKEIEKYSFEDLQSVIPSLNNF